MSAERDTATLLRDIQQLMTVAIAPLREDLGELRREFREAQRRTDDRLALMATREEVERRFRDEVVPRAEHIVKWDAAEKRIALLETAHRESHRSALEWCVMASGPLLGLASLLFGLLARGH